MITPEQRERCDLERHRRAMALSVLAVEEALRDERERRGDPIARRNAEDAAGDAMACNDHDGLS